MDFLPNGSIDPTLFDAIQQQRFAQLRERAAAAQARLAANQSTRTAQDGSVTVTVGNGGLLQHVRFGPRADSLSMVRLAESIMSTYQQACAEVAAGSIDIVADLAGEQSPTITAIEREVGPEIAMQATEIRADETRNDR